MSGHCPKCGTYHEEDDGRACADCRKAAPASTAAYLEGHADGMRMSRTMMETAISKLARTADGVPIYVGMKVFLRDDAMDADWDGWPVVLIGHPDRPEKAHFQWVVLAGIEPVTTSAVYSTREAAVAALAGHKGATSGNQ